MLSTTKLNTFTLNHNHNHNSEKLFKKTKFSPHMLSPLQKYKSQLNANANHLKSKYPNTDLDYIKSLLEELENNVEMVSDMLQEEQKKQVRTLMEDEQRSESQSSIYDSKRERVEQIKPEDVKVLQMSVAKLYKKFAQQKRQKQQLLKKLAALTKQNQNLKLMNQQLLKQQMSQVNLMNNLDIC